MSVCWPVVRSSEKRSIVYTLSRKSQNVYHKNWRKLFLEFKIEAPHKVSSDFSQLFIGLFPDQTCRQSCQQVCTHGVQGSEQLRKLLVLIWSQLNITAADFSFITSRYYWRWRFIFASVTYLRTKFLIMQVLKQSSGSNSNSYALAFPTMV